MSNVAAPPGRSVQRHVNRVAGAQRMVRVGLDAGDLHASAALARAAFVTLRLARISRTSFVSTL